MTKRNKTIYFIISILFFIFSDIFFSNILLDSTEKLPDNSFIDLLYIQNSGAAFSILQDSRLFLVCFSLLALAWILFYAIKNIENSSTIAMFWVSILVAGIFCNLYERVIFGYVRDFFKLNFINFPVFNISDIFINISVLAIVIIIIKHNFSKNDENNN